jgi:RNA polymerase sigma factor (sigma-70 family)
MERTPRADDGEAFRLFLQIRAAGKSVVGQRLCREFVGHPSVQCLVRCNCNTVLKDLRRFQDLRDDVAQEATLILMARLTGGKIHFVDEGADHFGRWLCKFCHAACADACERLRRQWRLRSADSRQLEQLAAKPVREHLRDSLMRAIVQIADPEVRTAMIHWFVEELSVHESAALLGVCERTVYRLRWRGLEALHELLALEFEGIP